MYTCAQCRVLACCDENREKMPLNCPMRGDVINQAFSEYQTGENHDFYVTSSEIEAMGYCVWPRVKEIMVLCRRMGYTKIGVAFCKGLQNEARILDGILRKNGFQVESVICKTGGIPKEQVGIRTECKLRPQEFEAMCNPIAQAMLLNQQETQLNIAVGLCVGHDSLFYKYSKALTTTLITKDRVTGHNPAAALYCAEGYFRNRIHLPEEE